MCIFSRKTTESETTSSIREKYGLDQGNERESHSVFVENIRAERARGEVEKEALLDRIDPLPPLVDMEDLNEPIEDLQGRLVDELIPSQGKPRKLLEKKMALLGDLAQFQQQRDSSMGMNSKRLANDLYYSQTEKKSDAASGAGRCAWGCS